MLGCTGHQAKPEQMVSIALADRTEKRTVVSMPRCSRSEIDVDLSLWAAKGMERVGAGPSPIAHASTRCPCAGGKGLPIICSYFLSAV